MRLGRFSPHPPCSLPWTCDRGLQLPSLSLHTWLIMLPSCLQTHMGSLTLPTPLLLKPPSRTLCCQPPTFLQAVPLRVPAYPNSLPVPVRSGLLFRKQPPRGEVGSFKITLSFSARVSLFTQEGAVGSAVCTARVGAATHPLYRWGNRGCEQPPVPSRVGSQPPAEVTAAFLLLKGCE